MFLCVLNITGKDLEVPLHCFSKSNLLVLLARLSTLHHKAFTRAAVPYYLTEKQYADWGACNYI